MSVSSRTCLIGNVASDVTQALLFDIFSQVGKVMLMCLRYDRESGLCKGYGYCEFENAQDARAARKRFNGELVNGRALRISMAGGDAEEDEAETIPVTMIDQDENEVETIRLPRDASTIRDMKNTLKRMHPEKSEEIEAYTTYIRFNSLDAIADYLESLPEQDTPHKIYRLDKESKEMVETGEILIKKN